MTYIVTSACAGTLDKSCIEVCPVDCFYDAGEQLVIAAAECIDCGACVACCPVRAIHPDIEMPPEAEEGLRFAAAFLAANPGARPVVPA